MFTKSLSKEKLFEEINSIINLSRDNVNEWVLKAGTLQLQNVVEALDEFIPTLLPYAKKNFRWRITDKANSSTVYYGDLKYTAVTSIPELDKKSVTGKLSVDVVDEEGVRTLRFTLNGESSFLRGYETLGGNDDKNANLTNRIWNQDFKSSYGVYPTSLFMNDDRLVITLEVKINGQ